MTALLVKEAEAEAALRKWTRARLDCIARGEATADDLTTPPEQPSAQLGGRDLLRNLVQMPTITGKLGAEGAICPPSDELRRGQGFGEWVEANNAQIERQAALRRQDEELTRRNNEARVRSFDRAHGPVRFAGTSPPSELNIVAGFEDDPIEPTGGAIGGDGWGAAFARAAAEGGR